jgi:hypothetical protein
MDMSSEIRWSSSVNTVIGGGCDFEVYSGLDRHSVETLAGSGHAGSLGIFRTTPAAVFWIRCSLNMKS